jgi:hypothetical protein
MLRFGVPAAIRFSPHQALTTPAFGSDLGENSRGRFISAAASKFQQPKRPRRASSADLVSKEEGTR